MIRQLTFALAMASLMGAPAFSQTQDATQDPFLQQVGEERMAAAWEVFEAAGTGRAYDSILPNVADNAKTTFIRSNPQMQLGIIEIVDKIALEMVARRQRFNEQLVRIWAAAFTKEELEQLRDFYSTPTGKKFAAIHPQVVTTQLGAAEVWSQLLGEEMFQRTTVALQELVAEEARALTGDENAPAPQVNPQ